MDVIERVREVNRVVDLSEARIAAAKARFLSGIAESSAPPKRIARRSTFVIAAAVVGAAAVTASVLAVHQSAAPPPRVEAVPVLPTVVPSASPSPLPTTVGPTPVTAASVFAEAARASVSDAAPAPQHGQYLRIDREVNNLVLYGPTNPTTPFDASRADATAAWTARSHWVLYVPADRSAEWVQEFSNQPEVAGFYGTSAEVHAQEWLGVGPREPFFTRTQGGLGEPAEGELSRASEAYYSEFPREPAALLEWIRVRNDATDGSEWSVGTVTEVVLEELQYNTAPADLRAALYRVLAMLPNSTITSVEGSIATVSFSPNARRWVSNQVSVDQSTGLVVGSAIRQDPGEGIVPGDVFDSWTTTTVSVVDAAP